MNLLQMAMLAVAFAVATRYGRDRTSALVALAALAGLCFLLHAWAGLLYATAWGVWRAASEHVVPPLTGRTLAATYGWHACGAVAMALACALAGQSPAKALLIFGLWALFATALDSWRAKVVFEGDRGTVNDPLHPALWAGGGAFGVALALVA